MSVRGYQLAADWMRTGGFDGANTDMSSYVQRGEMSVSYGRDLDGEATLSCSAAALGFNLNNHKRLFSDLPSSPLKGRILPGTPVRWEFTHPTSGRILRMFDGILDTYSIDTTTVARTLSGQALDSWGRPGGEALSTPLYRGIRSGDAINLVLDAAGWKGPRDIDAGASVFPWWWEEGTDAAAAIEKIVNSEGPPAMAYVEAGTFVFRDRLHRVQDARSRTSRGLYTHIVPAGSGPGGDFKMEKGSWSFDDGTKAVVNSASFDVQVRGAAAFGQVWRTDDPIAMPAGEVRQIVMQGSEPFFAAVAPVAGVDYTGSGSFDISLSRTSGQSATLTITCTSTGTMDFLQVRGYPVPVLSTVRVGADDLASKNLYGAQAWSGEPVWANVYDAQVVAERAVAIYAPRQPRVSFTIVGTSAAYLAQIVDQRIADRITIRNDDMQVYGDWIVERIEHAVDSLRIHRMRLTCVPPEPVQPTNVFTFNQAANGFNLGAFAVSGIVNPDLMMIFDKPGVGFDQGVYAT